MSNCRLLWATCEDRLNPPSNPKPRWYRKKVTKNSLSKLFFKNKGKLEIFPNNQRQRIHCQQTCLTRNTKRNPSVSSIQCFLVYCIYLKKMFAFSIKSLLCTNFHESRNRPIKLTTTIITILLMRKPRIKKIKVFAKDHSVCK